MSSVAINSPKTPVTKGSSGIAAATVPNVCKMPGPPAPFVPTPLPNIGKSDNSPDGYSTTVKIEGNAVAIQGASFKSMGDVASQGTGGGLVSNNVQGATKFIGPGSLNVRIEGKNVQLLGDQMMNNCGPSGSPPNAATMEGELQTCLVTLARNIKDIVCKCDRQITQAPQRKKQKTCAQLGREKHECCEKAIKELNHPQIQGEQGFGGKPKYTPISGTRQALKKSGGKKALRGTSWPDCTATDENGKKGFVDFKFRCPPNTPTRKRTKGGRRWIRTGPKARGWPNWTVYKDGTTQKEKYESTGKANGITKEPVVMTNKGCRK